MSNINLSTTITDQCKMTRQESLNLYLDSTRKSLSNQPDYIVEKIINDELRLRLWEIIEVSHGQERTLRVINRSRFDVVNEVFHLRRERHAHPKKYRFVCDYTYREIVED